MRIARIVQYFQPHFGYADYYLMMEFKRLGHDVCIITSDRLSPGVLFFNNSLNLKVSSGKYIEHELNVYRLPTIFESDNLLINRHGVKEILEDFKPDIVHSNDLFYLPTILSLKYKETIGYKMFIDSITGTFNPNKIKSVAFKLFKWVLGGYLRKKTDGFFAISEGSKRWLSKNFSIPDNNINIIPLGADGKLFAPDIQSRNSVRSKLNILDEDVVLIYSGKILPEKDIDVLVKGVAELVRTSFQNIKLVIVGNGPQNYLNHLYKIIDSNGIQRHTIFIPTVDREELPKYFNAADIAVWPGVPSISIIEAMSTGLPIVIARYSTPREDAYDTAHLIKYDNGLVFNRGRIYDLVNCLKKLILDDFSRKEMGKNSRKLVQDKLNWSCIAEKYIELYQAQRNH